MNEKAEVQYPAMRYELVSAIRALSDVEYQKRVWVNRVYPKPGYYDDFSMAVHTLYDDLYLENNLQETIGRVLRDQAEADLVSVVIERLNEVLKEYGDAPDEEVIRSPSWGGVVEAAGKALDGLERSS